MEFSEAVIPSSGTIEVKEAMKVDDAEYVGYVASKSSLGSGSWVSVVSLIAMFSLIGYLFNRLLKTITFRRLAFSILALTAITFFVFGNVEAGAIAVLAEVPLVPDAQAQKDLLEKVKNEAAEASKKKIDEFKEEFKNLAAQAKTGMISEEVFNGKLRELTENLSKIDPEKFKAYEEKLTQLTKAAEAQDLELKKLKETGIGQGQKKHTLMDAVSKALKTDQWKEFVDSNGKRKASFSKDNLEELKTVSVTSDYTGTSLVHITTRDGRVVDHPQVVRLNIRDLLTVAPTDLPYLAFLEVYDWVRAVRPHSENESLAQSSFKVREATAQVKRIGTSLPISKRMLKSSSFIESHLASRLPAQVRYNEDFYLLFGDGLGNNPTGIFEVADDFATVINTTITGGPGSISSVATYDGGAKTLVNFEANQNINNGDTITLANAGGYNGDYTAIVIGPRQIVIEQAYSAGSTAAFTFTISSKFKNAVFAAQEIDVLKVAKTLVTRQEYSCTGIVLHPDDATKIELLKGNDEHYLDVQRLESGILTIAGVPVVETTAMPSGKFAVGDWRMACALFEFTGLMLEFSESTNEKLTNTVMAIVQEEILFPIYNKYMFIVGDFVTAKAAIAETIET